MIVFAGGFVGQNVRNAWDVWGNRRRRWNVEENRGSAWGKSTETLGNRVEFLEIAEHSMIVGKGKSLHTTGLPHFQFTAFSSFLLEIGILSKIE